MKFTRLKNKILLGAVIVGTVVAGVTMVAASMVINKQHLAQSQELLRKASGIIEIRLADNQAFLLAAARKLAAQKSLGSTIWYLEQYAQSDFDRETLLNTYQKLAGETLKAAQQVKLSRVLVYDSAGRLISFALSGKDGAQAGYVERLPRPVLQVSTLKGGEEWAAQNWQARDSIDGINPRWAGNLPRQEGVFYTVAEGVMAIESVAPIMGETFAPDTGKPEIKQLGLVYMVQPISQDFAELVSRLDNVKINIFAGQRLSSGDEPAYKTLDAGNGRVEQNATGQEIILNEIEAGGVAYFQSLIPLVQGKREIGTIALLYSKEVARKSIRELERMLGLIAALSLLFIVPYSWFFATTLTRPLTALSRIFSEVAASKQTGTFHAEIDRLKKEQLRQDEIGDLAQGFMRMHQAIDEKIREINEINASLEEKVRARTTELARREQELRTLVDNTPDSIARYDLECRRIYVNPAFGELTEGGMASLLGKRPSEFPGGKQAEIYEQRLREIIATGRNGEFEYKWRGKNGEEIYSHLRLTVEFGADGSVASVLAIGRDITELNRTKEEISRKELAKTRFLAAAGHDLRQPLAAANLLIDSLNFTELSPQQVPIVRNLEQAMDTFRGLLESLLNISKLDAGSIKPEYATFSVYELVSWVEQCFAPMAAEKNLDFRLHFPLKQPLYVHTDIGLVKSVLMNLVSNALKYTQQGAVLVGARRRGSEALLQVWDTGDGIPEEHLKYIFDEFYQVGNSQRDRTKGLGLGLSIARRELSLLGGVISCRSRVDRGSVFEFRLPLAAPPGGLAYGARREPSWQGGQLSEFVRGRRFILVEDDALVANALSHSIAAMGGWVECFQNAEEALRQPGIADGDCLIVDFMLGGERNGLQLLDQLQQKQGRPIHAVLMTGDTSPDFIRATAACVWPVLYKPVDLFQLISAFSAQMDHAI
jgi:PAS domain S-box-containing protein